MQFAKRSRLAAIPVVCAAVFLTGIALHAQTQTQTAPQTKIPKTKPKSKAPAKPLLDLNKASAAELEELSGVGPTTAKKIVAGRPYTKIDDLAKAGVTA